MGFSEGTSRGGGEDTGTPSRMFQRTPQTIRTRGGSNLPRDSAWVGSNQGRTLRNSKSGPITSEYLQQRGGWGGGGNVDAQRAGERDGAWGGDGHQARSRNRDAEAGIEGGMNGVAGMNGGMNGVHNPGSPIRGWPVKGSTGGGSGDSGDSSLPLVSRRQLSNAQPISSDDGSLALVSRRQLSTAQPISSGDNSLPLVSRRQLSASQPIGNSDDDVWANYGTEPLTPNFVPGSNGVLGRGSTLNHKP